MGGLKNVRDRYSDAMSRVSWDRFEHLLADHYRQQGYQVDHCGTAASGTRFDGGIDLKLRRGDEFILVQCKHWNAKQVPHNDVHQLLGLMVNEGATGAILVTSGEFTAAARHAAGKLGHVQLVDGAALRVMVGPIAEPVAHALLGDRATHVVSHVGERLLSAAEDRIRYGGGGRPRDRRGGAARTGVQAVLVSAALKVVLFIAFALFVVAIARATLESVLRTIAPPSPPAAPVAVPPAPVSDAPRASAPNGTYRAPASVDAPTGTSPPAAPTAAEIRESQRKADEAIKVIEQSTPEM